MVNGYLASVGGSGGGLGRVAIDSFALDGRNTALKVLLTGSGENSDDNPTAMDRFALTVWLADEYGNSILSKSSKFALFDTTICYAPHSP
jgi:hypothetical protein